DVAVEGGGDVVRAGPDLRRIRGVAGVEDADHAPAHLAGDQLVAEGAVAESRGNVAAHRDLAPPRRVPTPRGEPRGGAQLAPEVIQSAHGDVRAAVLHAVMVDVDHPLER